jgi:PAS domain S-box-containing protein
MKWRFPVSLKVTVPLILLGFAATLSTVNLLYHVPKAERAEEEDSRKRLAQEVSRLQSTLEYLLLKGDDAVANHEIAVLAHTHDVIVAALTDDEGNVIASTRGAWIGRPIDEVMPHYDLNRAQEAIRQRRAGLTVSDDGQELLGYAGILMTGAHDEIRPSRTGSLFLAYDLAHYKAEARAHVIEQSVYWAGWVTALALAMWLTFHFLLTRRTARLVHAAEEIAAGNLSARSGLGGDDELGRLGRAFDAMALEVAETQTRLRHDISERVRVQYELEASEARLQQILNNATAVVSVKDTEGRFLFVNRHWEHLHRMPKATVVGKLESDCLPPDVAPTYRANDMMVLARNAPMEFEETARLADGVHTYISIKFPLHDSAGVAYAVCTIATDITERKRSDEALRVSEASYRAIFDAAEDAIFVLDIKTALIVDANPRACAVFGYTLDEMRCVDASTLGSGEVPYTSDAAMAQFARAVAGEEMRLEWHGKAKDGTLRWFEVCGKRVTIAGVDRILSLLHDITDRKAAEEALIASEEQYRAMFNASIDGLALWNEAGEIVETNPALRRIFGYDGEEEFAALPARRWCGLSQHPDFLRVVMSGTPLRIELAETRKDGAQVDIEVHGVPMQYGGQPHVLTITRDVTAARRAASELTRQRELSHQREKLAALGSLLAGVSHELNNPLSVVVARAVLLEEQGDAATQAAATKIRTAAERCARIVRTFLAMARQQQPERGPVGVNDVVTAALDITAYAVRTSSIEVELDLAQGMPQVLADADQLHQVFLNLIINAQQSLQEHALPRKIRIASRYDAAALMVRVTVADNGAGIPRSIRARIFEPYFTTKPQGVGTGVGLAVSLGIVEAHGGSIAVDCPARGGAEFTVSLPVGMVQAASGDIIAPPGAYVCPRSVLVIDDEADIRETLSEILSGAGHRVMTANSGREALVRLSTEHYDVILSDIRMPDLDGRALHEEIDKRWPGRTRRVVFITGDTLAAGLGEFLHTSGRPVIEKPFLPAEVRRIVADLVAKSESPALG